MSLFFDNSIFNEEIDDAIFNYDDRTMELLTFGRRIYLDPDLVSRANRIPCKGGRNVDLQENPQARKG